MKVTTILSSRVETKNTDCILSDADFNSIITFESATPVACILQKGLRIGFSCTVIQKGTGTITFTTPGNDDEVNGGIITPPTKGQWGWAKILCIANGKFTVDFGGGDSTSTGGIFTLLSQFGTKFTLAVLEETDENNVPLGTGSLTITKTL